MSDPHDHDSFPEVLARARGNWDTGASPGPAEAIAVAITPNFLRGLGEMEEREQFSADRHAARRQMREAVEQAVARISPRDPGRGDTD